jgi:hypothetical protein
MPQAARRVGRFFEMLLFRSKQVVRTCQALDIVKVRGSKELPCVPLCPDHRPGPTRLKNPTDQIRKNKIASGSPTKRLSQERAANCLCQIGRS